MKNLLEKVKLDESFRHRYTGTYCVAARYRFSAAVSGGVKKILFFGV